MKTKGIVYIMSSPDKTALYTGITSNLHKRVWEHKNKTFPGSFSAKYNCVMLVYYSMHETILDAIAEEKRIKAGSRKRKENLIYSLNPDWKDLYEEML